MATEKRLIDANKAKYFIADILDIFNVPIGDRMANRLLKVVDTLPTVDAVEVVRCGECKHFCEPFCIRRDDETHRERINMLTVDFCSYGERKDQ